MKLNNSVNNEPKSPESQRRLVADCSTARAPAAPSFMARLQHIFIKKKLQVRPWQCGDLCCPAVPRLPFYFVDPLLLFIDPLICEPRLHQRIRVEGSCWCKWQALPFLTRRLRQSRGCFCGLELEPVWNKKKRLGSKNGNDEGSFCVSREHGSQQ